MAQQPTEFAAFYLDTRDDCLRVVFASTGNLQLSEDLVAEAFVKAFASWQKVALHPVRDLRDRQGRHSASASSAWLLDEGTEAACTPTAPEGGPTPTPRSS